MENDEADDPVDEHCIPYCFHAHIHPLYEEIGKADAKYSHDEERSLHRKLSEIAGAEKVRTQKRRRPKYHGDDMREQHKSSNLGGFVLQIVKTDPIMSEKSERQTY